MTVSEINGHEITQLDVQTQIGDRTNCSVGAFFDHECVGIFSSKGLAKGMFEEETFIIGES